MPNHVLVEDRVNETIIDGLPERGHAINRVDNDLSAVHHIERFLGPGTFHGSYIAKADPGSVSAAGCIIRPNICNARFGFGYGVTLTPGV
jgi:hypothetical protein